MGKFLISPLAVLSKPSGAGLAIYHLSAQIISRAEGRSAVAAAAYRRATELTCAATGQVFDYGAKEHVTHAELSLPAEVPAWFRTAIDGRDDRGASEVLWNAVEAKEGLKGTGLAMEMNIALPAELTREQALALARDWIESQVTAKGFVADWAVHEAAGNPHFHVMIPLRRMTEQGFAAKFELLRDAAGNVVYRDDGKPRYERMAAPMKELAGWRRSWAETANRHLAEAGLEVRIDHRSHAEAGIALEPTGHVGVTATNMAVNGKEAARVTEERALRARNAAAIVADPGLLLPILTREKSVFEERDIARAVFRYVDDPATFEAVRLRLGTSPELVAVCPEVIDPETERVIAQARFTTRTMLRTELAMQAGAARLWTEHSHVVGQAALNAALAARPSLSEAQREAVVHVTGRERIAAVVGFAGAGKSTMLGVANSAWTGSGHRVFGAALAGKAAEGLERSSGIASRTLASWELAWKEGRDQLETGDVFVLDEAGMVSSQQLARVVEAVERRGAKLVLVGDAMQLQPIEAGAAFRAITEAVGYIELAEIWRQSDPRMRQASVALARGETEAALTTYRELGMVRFTASREAARAALIAAWKPDYLATKPDGRPTETLILAQTNQDVFALNALAREALKAEGRLAGEARFMTARGERQFAAGDRVLFLENDRQLGVKNGMLASVVAVANGLLRVRLDQDGVGDGRVVEIAEAAYRNIDHGYAATVHKSQGATLDRVHVLATPGMDRHLAYVAMTRHRHSAVLHAAHADFIPDWRRDKLEGKLGSAPSAAEYDEAALTGLVRRLSRDGAKETTLDYQGEADYREEAARLANPAVAASLADLERQLAVAERREELTAERVRPRDLRALASAFAERRGLNGPATVWPGLVARLRGLVDELRLQWAELRSLSDRLGAAMAGPRARVAASIAPVEPPAPDRPAAQPAPTPADAAQDRPPPMPFLAAVDLGETGLEAAVAARAAAMKTVDRPRTKLAENLADMVRDPKPLLAAIQAELTQPEAVFAERVDALLAAPERFGGLHGGTGLFASKTAKRQRDWAVRSLPVARREARELKAAHEAQLAAARRDELAYRAHLRIALPGLSVAAQEAIRAVAQAKPGTQDAAVARVVADQALYPEIEAFARAAGERFGRDGSIGHRLEPRLPPGHGPVTQELRYLMNGAGILAARLARQGKLDQVPQQDLRRRRDLSPGL